MEKKILLIVFLMVGKVSFGQYYYQMYYDPNHYAAVTTNQLARMSAEQILTNQTKEIKENVEAINQNMLKVVATKNLIYNALVNVNEALKDGKEMIYIGQLINDIFDEAAGVSQLAKDNPHLTIFAEQSARNVKVQSIDLFNELSRFILKDGRDAMMNFNTRDELLRNITHRLQLLRAELYLMRNSMYWAKMNGIWRSLNPFQDWINEDRSIINSIIYKVKTLKQ